MADVTVTDVELTVPDCCPICLDSIDSEQKITVKGCSHTFCKPVMYRIAQHFAARALTTTTHLHCTTLAPALSV